jgi:hypothetical protein
VIPALEPSRRPGSAPKLHTVLADSGYVSEETFARADADGLRLLAPLAKTPADATSGSRNGQDVANASSSRRPSFVKRFDLRGNLGGSD